MIDPYKLIVINIIASTTLIILIIIFKFLNPKKKLNLLLLLLLISVLPLISILRKGTYESGDLSLHAVASMSFYDALFDKQIVPRWGGDLINGFGSPYHTVMYLFPYYVISLIHFLGFNILNSIKFFLALSFISSGIAMFLLMKKEYGDKAALTSAIFYLFAPYHLVDMHYRVDIGEMAAFVFLPLTFYFINKIVETRQFIFFILESISVAFLILSHQAISLFFVPFIFLYAVFKLYRSKALNYQNLALNTGSIVTGMLLASFYILPILFEATKYTLYGKNAINSDIYLHHLTEYIFSPWRWGFLFQGPTGQLSFMIGYSQLFIIFFALYLLIKKRISKRDKSYLIFLILSFFIIFFIMLPQSKFLWQILPIAKYTLSTYRYLLILSFFVAVIGGIVVKNIKNKYFFVFICFITILYTILNWGNRGTIPTISDDAYFKNKIPTFILGEEGNGNDLASPIWIDQNKSYFRKSADSNIEVIKGKVKFDEIVRNSTNHEYIIHAFTNSVLLENTIYYPGWILYIDGKRAEINYQYPKKPGIISFAVPSGLHKINLLFEKTKVRQFGDSITLITIFLLALIFALKSKMRKVLTW